MKWFMKGVVPVSWKRVQKEAVMKPSKKKFLRFPGRKSKRPISASPVRTFPRALFETMGIQVVNQRDVLKKYAESTWVVSVERFPHLLV